MSDIPPLFHSVEHDGPFESCLTCKESFDEISAPYTVTKVYKGPECVFEYAMCLSCRQKMIDEMSSESRDTLESHFQSNKNLRERENRFGDSEHHTDYLRDCAHCLKPLNEIKDYSIACMAFGSDMVYGPFPMMVCSECEEAIQEKLSKKTREEFDRFVSENFEGPPAESIDPPKRLPLLV
ncbi:MAG: hypothetical protein CBC46_02325 [Verrucomicrobiaceae bacterium TMED86]|nr:MAG: hypothetical protein CBC46_02325 [Verrucomicrobiaceae bacterium TMED86]